MTNAWETIPDTDPLARRMRVPGGWLYQAEHHVCIEPVESRPGHYMYGWHAPVFVPDPDAVRR